MHEIYWDIDEQKVSWSCSGIFGVSRDITFFTGKSATAYDVDYVHVRNSNPVLYKS